MPVLVFVNDVSHVGEMLAGDFVECGKLIVDGLLIPVWRHRSEILEHATKST